MENLPVEKTTNYGKYGVEYYVIYLDIWYMRICIYYRYSLGGLIFEDHLFKDLTSLLNPSEKNENVIVFVINRGKHLPPKYLYTVKFVNSEFEEVVLSRDPANKFSSRKKYYERVSKLLFDARRNRDKWISKNKFKLRLTIIRRVIGELIDKVFNKSL